jgi:signal peptidase
MCGSVPFLGVIQQLWRFHFKRIWGTVSTVCVAIAVILAVFLAGVRLVGLQPYVVLSGSMEPAYPVGSMIYTVKTQPDQLREGDPLTFRLEAGNVATHRIIEILPPEKDGEQLRFLTKGDANSIADEDPIPADRILGKPVLCIPLLGFVAEYIQRPPGLYVIVGLGMVIVILSFFSDLIPKRKDTKKEIYKTEGA